MIAKQIRSAVALNELTTFGLGGRASSYLRAVTNDDLIAGLRWAKEKSWPYLILAGGSNVVFGDAGFAGLVIHFFDPDARAVIQDRRVSAPAQMLLSKLIEQTTSVGLAGLESLSGIPGTVGGAVVGNAGAYGQGISDRLTRVEIYDVESQALNTKCLTKAECHFAYRESIFKQNRDLIVLQAEFELEPGDSETLKQRSQEIIKTREKKYPPGLKCPGSFFKNVLVKNVSPASLKWIDQSKIIDGKIPAGYLLEIVGSKGMRQGGVYIADYHGNLLVNDGTATYEDVIILATKLKKLVHDKFGIEIEEEVRCVS